MSKEAFDKRVLPMKERIFRLARTMLCEVSEAEDITQDILVKLWHKRDMLERLDNSEAYIYMMARNTCLDHIRQRKIRTQVLSTKYVENGPDQSHDVVEMREMKQLVERMIAELPGKQQLVMHLRDIEGYDFPEIVNITGMSEATARVMLSRARKMIREKLIRITGYGV